MLLRTGPRLVAACHEAVRLWVERAVPLNQPSRRVGNGSSAREVAERWAKSQDIEFAKRLLAGFAALFPLIAIPVMELQSRKIARLEAELADREKRLKCQARELEVVRETNRAAVSGVIF
eukprot:TRINITY_DN12658_c1_g1_i1.p2 TRINITY_DN12658_c1_g1~~TRINITY_DN12658_c1_g1_i1.p2  ORF type:complete len:120 (-),score=31.76 TRINITY_DN12658_c1_g1_i1:152-511(-)